MKTSKVFYLCICLACVAVMLFGCGLHTSPSKEPVASFVQTESTQSVPQQTETATTQPVIIFTEPQPTTVADENLFLPILEGTGTFLYEGDTVTLEDYCATFGTPVTIDTVAVADLEWDGIPEVLLDVKTGAEYSYGVLVLHLEDNDVWGYTFAQRQLRDIKEDGTFSWAGSSSNAGVATLSLSSGTFEYNNQLWVEEDEDGTSHFFVGDEEVDSEEYNEKFMEWVVKEGTPWKPYPMDSYMNLF